MKDDTTRTISKHNSILYKCDSFDTSQLNTIPLFRKQTSSWILKWNMQCDTSSKYNKIQWEEYEGEHAIVEKLRKEGIYKPKETTLLKIKFQSKFGYRDILIPFKDYTITISTWINSPKQLRAQIEYQVCISKCYTDVEKIQENALFSEYNYTTFKYFESRNEDKSTTEDDDNEYFKSLTTDDTMIILHSKFEEIIHLKKDFDMS